MVNKGTGDFLVEEDLTPNNFSLVFNKSPKFSLNIQQVNLPGLSVESPRQNSPFADRPLIGSKVSYDDLVATFVVDKYANTWIQLHDWMAAMDMLKFGPDKQKYKDKGDHRQFLTDLPDIKETNSIIPGGSMYNDATLIINDAAGIPKIHVDFVDIFPTSLSDLNLSTIMESDEQITAQVTFKYWYYSFRK